MKILDPIFSHRNGLDLLQSPRFKTAFDELRSVLAGLPPYRSARVKKKAAFVISPGAMNRWLDQELCIKRDWDWHPKTVPAESGDTETSDLTADYRKSRIEVEVQFGNVARYTYDVYKMAISMALGNADVGIMVVPSKRFMHIIGDNLAYFERAVRELSRSRMTLIVPLVVIGIEPDGWDVTRLPREAQAPKVNASAINAARRRRGLGPVPEPPPEPADVSLAQIRALARRIA